MTPVLVDADTLLYKTAYKYQTGIVDWGEGIYSDPTTDLDGAKQALDDEVAELKATLFADPIVFATTGDTNFRKKVWPLYKANRTAPKPELLKPLKEYLRETQATLEYPNIEADDILGICGTDPKGGEIILVSVDKDLLQIPSLHYNPMHPELGVFEITSLEGFRQLEAVPGLSPQQLD